MNKNFTHELLVRHLYGETTPTEKEYMARELATDESLHRELEELLEVKHFLDDGIRSPSETSIRIIMEHSASSGYLQES